MPNSLSIAKIEAKKVVTRISIQSRNRSLKIAGRLMDIIQQAKSEAIVNKIKAELDDILMHVDLEIIESPDDYFNAMIQHYSNRP